MSAKPPAGRNACPTRRRRRGLILLAVLLALLGAVYFGGEAAMAPILRHRLQAMVASHLNADLRINRLSYHFPYGVTVTDASLLVRAPGDRTFELVKVSRIELKLAEYPKRSGPLVIERLVIVDPVVHLMHTRAGVTGEGPLVKDAAQSPPPPDMKLSDMFRLRHFAIERGRFEYEDPARPDVGPMVWTDLNVDLDSEPQGPAVYGYRVSAKNEPVAEVSSSGTMNVDSLALSVKELATAVQVSPDGQAKLPAALQQWLAMYQVRGALKLSGNGELPLRNLPAARFDAAIDLPSATARVPRWDATLDRLHVKLHCTADGAGAMAVTVEAFDAASGAARLTLQKALGSIDARAGTWKVADALGTLSLAQDPQALPASLRNAVAKLRPRGTVQLTATASGPLHGGGGADTIQYELVAVPRDLSVQPDDYPLPIDRINGIVRLMPGLVKAENLAGRYGEDRLFVATARVPLGQRKPPGEVPFDEIDGSVTFAGQPQEYPRALKPLLEALRPSGTWTITGNYRLRPKGPERRWEYKLGISSDHGAIAPPPLRVPITEVRCDILCRAEKGGEGVFDITAAQGNALGGRVTASGQVETGTGEAGKMLDYRGAIKAIDLDLRQLAPYLAEKGKDPTKVSGRGFLDAGFSGSGAYDGKNAARNLRAQGEFEIVDGEFWEIPVMKEIVGDVKGMKEALTVGQAAGTFEIRDRVVRLSNAAVSAPVLGLQGSGTIGFDGKLDLRVIAAPLADWKDKMKRTGIPIVSDAVGEVAGGIQKLLNSATKALLYEFRVGGDVSKPRLTTVPAPAISQATAKLFGSMISAGKDLKLIEALREKK